MWLVNCNPILMGLHNNESLLRNVDMENNIVAAVVTFHIIVVSHCSVTMNAETYTAWIDFLLNLISNPQPHNYSILILPISDVADSTSHLFTAYFIDSLHCKDQTLTPPWYNLVVFFHIPTLLDTSASYVLTDLSTIDGWKLLIIGFCSSLLFSLSLSLANFICSHLI